MASATLSRTNVSSVTNNKKFTISFWVKRSSVGTGQNTIFGNYTSSTDYNFVYWNSADQLLFYYYNGSQQMYLRTNRKFRDTSAWYHIVLAIDTTQATASDRIKIYVNGSQETSLDQTDYGDQNMVMPINENSQTQKIGNENSSNYFDGILTHFNFIDGTQYQASDFGETDSTSGIWKPKTAPSVTYGTNGFFLKFENSSDFGEDSSGNNNDFTTSGTITQTEDTPSNNFATLNPLDASAMSGEDNTFSNGNLSVTDGAGSYIVAQSTLATSKGKYYWEVKINATTSSSVSGVGICDFDNFTKTTGAGNTAYGWIYTPDGSKRNNSTASSYGNSYTTNDIIGIALDMDNGYLYFSKNGVWQNSGDPTSGASGTGSAYGSISGTIGSHAYDGSGSEAHEFSYNFGNGYFGTTAVSSSNSDSAGLGLFEYSVPSGYYSLCTKNIKNYG